MKNSLLVIVLLLAFILQTTVLQYIELWNVKPNLIIIIIISIAILRGSVAGAAIGLAGGALWDLISFGIFGLHSMLGLYTGLVAGLLSYRFVKESYFVAVLFTFVLSFLYELSYFLLRFYIWERLQFVEFVKDIMLPQAIYSSIFAIPIFHYLIKISRQLDKNKEDMRKY